MSLGPHVFIPLNKTAMGAFTAAGQLDQCQADRFRIPQRKARIQGGRDRHMPADEYLHDLSHMIIRQPKTLCSLIESDENAE
jgi:hypothetical protein